MRTIPRWVKTNPIYPRGRAAILSLLGSPRFYNPISAVRLCVPEYEHWSKIESLINEIYVVGEDDGVKIWHTPIGDLATPSTEIVDHTAFLIDEFQRNVYLSGPVRIVPGSIVLDIGANIGIFAKRAISAGARQVVSIEPVPATVLALRWNLASEIAMNRALILQMGVWDKSDALRFVVDAKRPGRSSCVEASSEKDVYETTINVKPLDLIIKELDLPRADFIKIDIEGAELRALQGAREVLVGDKPQLAIAVEHTSDQFRNACLVRDLVLSINPAYRCIPGPYLTDSQRRLSPELLYFK